MHMTSFGCLMTMTVAWVSSLLHHPRCIYGFQVRMQSQRIAQVFCATQVIYIVCTHAVLYLLRGSTVG